MIISLGLLLAVSAGKRPAPPTPPVFVAHSYSAPPVVAVPPPRPPASVMARQPVNAPVPRQPIISLISPDDYPAVLGEHRRGPRGVVALRLFVDASGRIYTCALKPTSAEEALKRATCLLVQRRARFTPAVDSQRAPTSGVFDAEIDWDAVFKRVRR